MLLTVAFQIQIISPLKWTFHFHFNFIWSINDAFKIKHWTLNYSDIENSLFDATESSSVDEMIQKKKNSIEAVIF